MIPPVKRLSLSFAALLLLTAIFHVGLSSCSPTHPPGKPTVACTNSILADITRSVAGAHVDVTVLAGPLDDPHKIVSTPELVRAVGSSWAVFENGLGLEPWLDEIVKAAPGDHPRYVATKGVSPILREDGTPDPHAWLDPQRVMTYVLNARDMLIFVDPDHENEFHENADALIESIKGTDAYIVSIVEGIAPLRRCIFSVHDSFRYFAARYGFKTRALAPLGVTPTPDMETAANDWLGAEKIYGMFAEAARDEQGIRALSFKNGRRVGGPLWTDTLDAPGKPGGTWNGAMRENLRMISEVLH